MPILPLHGHGAHISRIKQQKHFPAEANKKTKKRKYYRAIECPDKVLQRYIGKRTHHAHPALAWSQCSYIENQTTKAFFPAEANKIKKEKVLQHYRVPRQGTTALYKAFSRHRCVPKIASPENEQNKTYYSTIQNWRGTRRATRRGTWRGTGRQILEFPPCNPPLCSQRGV